MYTFFQKMNPLSDISPFLSFAVYQFQRQFSVTQLQKALNSLFKSKEVYFLKQLNSGDSKPTKTDRISTI